MRGFPVLLELDLAVGVVQVQHRVEGVVVHLPRRVGHAGRDRYRLCSCGGRWHCCPSRSQPIPHGRLDVLGGAHQFEAVQVRHSAFARIDVARIAELRAEIGVTGGDDPAQQRPVVLVVEECDDLLGHVAARVDVRGRMTPAVGRQHQHVRLVHLDPAAQRDPDGLHSQLLHEAVRVLRNAGEIHQPAVRYHDILLGETCRAMRSTGRQEP